jgi:hypothetical protein
MHASKYEIHFSSGPILYILSPLSIHTCVHTPMHNAGKTPRFILLQAAKQALLFGFES